jgi:CubicO group peptidase (beta-lactamase class C family)
MWLPRPDRRANREGPGDYGYQWWVTNETGHDGFRAQGYGGQLIQVIPDLDLVVVVITSDVNQESRDPSKLVRAVIVPAVTSQLLPAAWLRAVMVPHLGRLHRAIARVIPSHPSRRLYGDFSALDAPRTRTAVSAVRTSRVSWRVSSTLAGLSREASRPWQQASTWPTTAA